MWRMMVFIIVLLCCFLVGKSTASFTTTQPRRRAQCRCHHAARTIPARHLLLLSAQSGINDSRDQNVAQSDINDSRDQNVEIGDEPEDTVRVRIWRALAAQNGREVSVAQLATNLGERRSDIRHHLKHVEKQCKTLQSKSTAWRLRRGLPADAENGSTKKLRITTRRGGGKRNELFIKLH